MATAVSSVTNYKMLIGGEWVDASSGQTYDSMNPYTGLTWAQIPDAQAAASGQTSTARCRLPAER